MTSGQPAVVSGVSTFGDIVLSNARLDTSAYAAGTVFLRGGRLIMTDSSEIRAHSVDGTGGAATARILVHAQNISVNGGGMETSTSGTQPGGDILMNGEQITLTNTLIASASTSSATNAGRAGTIIVQGIAGPGSPATRVSLATTSEISTAINGGSADITPSNITITTETLELADVAQIQANTTGATSAGDITFNVDTLTATGLSTIRSISGGERSGIRWMRSRRPGTLRFRGSMALGVRRPASASPTKSGPTSFLKGARTSHPAVLRSPQKHWT